jgi:hypothetical protein
MTVDTTAVPTSFQSHLLTLLLMVVMLRQLSEGLTPALHRRCSMLYYLTYMYPLHRAADRMLRPLWRTGVIAECVSFGKHQQCVADLRRSPNNSTYLYVQMPNYFWIRTVHTSNPGTCVRAQQDTALDPGTPSAVAVPRPAFSFLSFQDPEVLNCIIA